MTRAKALDRIRKLQALADRPGTEAEGAAAAAEVRRVMAANGITDLDLGGSATPRARTFAEGSWEDFWEGEIERAEQAERDQAEQWEAFVRAARRAPTPAPSRGTNPWTGQEIVSEEERYQQRRRSAAFRKDEI